MKKLTIALFFLAIGIAYSTAQEVITFKWEGSGTNRRFGVNFSADNEFTVDWGNGNRTTHTTSEGFAWVYQPENYNDNAVYQVTIASGESASFVGLYIWSCLVTALDVSQSTELIELGCPYNKITELNVRNNPKLINLLCEGNLLTELDLSENTKLIDLACSLNCLTSLNVNQCRELKTMSCSKNRLTELDVSQNTGLVMLICDNNLITELDLNQNKKLDDLYCFDNLLTELNVSQCTELRYLYCENNSLINLDVTKNLRLFQLGCECNALTSLDLSKNRNLALLTCNDNCLPLSDLYIASKQIPMPELKHLGKQNLPSQTTQANKPLSLLNEMVFEGVRTVFSVTKDGNPATENVDYKLDYQNQNISFLKNGNYIVTMANEIITSEPEHPALVIMPIVVSNNTSINTIKQASLSIYPNPVADNLYISSEKKLSRIILRDLSGKTHGQVNCNSTTVTLNMSSYGKGIWLLDIEFESGSKEIMKIVKM